MQRLLEAIDLQGSREALIRVLTGVVAGAAVPQQEHISSGWSAWLRRGRHESGMKP